MKAFKIALASLSFIALTGCASIAGDNTRAVSVNSQPAGAAVLVDNQQYGVTPAVITLPTYIYGGKSVTLKKHGYQEQTTMVNSKFQPIALLDIFFWPSFLIDAATGNLVKIDPANRSINTTLHRA